MVERARPRQNVRAKIEALNDFPAQSVDQDNHIERVLAGSKRIDDAINGLVHGGGVGDGVLDRLARLHDDRLCRPCLAQAARPRLGGDSSRGGRVA